MPGPPMPRIIGPEGPETSSADAIDADRAQTAIAAASIEIFIWPSAVSAGHGGCLVISRLSAGIDDSRTAHFRERSVRPG